MRDKALKIYNQYGYKNQLKKLSEEVYEFIEAGNGDIEHVIEELGDVEFLMYQFKCANDIKNYEVKRVFQSKADRQLYRMSRNMTTNPVSEAFGGVFDAIKKMFGIK